MHLYNIFKLLIWSISYYTSDYYLVVTNTFKGPMKLLQQKTVVCNLNKKYHKMFQIICDAILKRHKKIISPSPLTNGIHKQEVTFLSLIMWQRVKHYLEIGNHIIVAFKWILNFQQISSEYMPDIYVYCK